MYIRRRHYSEGYRAKYSMTFTEIHAPISRMVGIENAQRS